MDKEGSSLSPSREASDEEVNNRSHEEDNFDSTEDFHDQDGAEEEGERVEVTPETISAIEKSIGQGDLKAARKVLNMFSFVFNERKLNRKVNYLISRPKVLQDLSRLFLFDLPKALTPLIGVKKREGLLMVYAKNVLLYLRNLLNPAMEAFTIRSLIGSMKIFESRPALRAALLKTVVEKWAESEDMSVKLNSFLVLKETIPGSGELGKKLLNLMLKTFYRKSGDLRWDNYNHFIFMRNCFREIVLLEPGIAFVVVFDKVREIGAAIIKCSTNKSLENVKKIYNSRYMPLISLLADLAIDFAKHPVLREINFPLIETLIAYTEVYPKTEYYPLLLHVYDNLTRVMEQTSQRFSIALGLIRMLKTKYLRTKLSSNSSTFDFDIKSKFTAEDLQNDQHWREFLTKALWILKRNLVLHHKEGYFDSYCMMILRFLKLLSKSKMSVDRKRLFIRLFKQTASDIKTNKQLLNESQPDSVLQFQLLNDLSEENQRREEAIALKVKSAKANVREKQERNL